MAGPLAGVVAEHEADLLALSHDLHAHPELAFAEHRSAALVADALAAGGFEVTRGIVGLDTAFVATAGSGDMRVGVFAEYDALPGIGHACGHNVIAAAAVGAGLALASVADELGITVEVYGTPAEESGGGKVLMLQRGAFDGLACAGMVHPGPFDVAGARSFALADLAVEYMGRRSHASAAPHLGRNAGDAVTIAQVAIGLLRQHLEPGQQLHGIVSSGGEAPNIVPGAAELLYYLRADSADSVTRLRERAEACFAAGAVATGCTHRVHEVSPLYTELVPDPWLTDAYRAAVVSLGREPVPAADEVRHPVGSTDMGNVSHAIPSIHPLIGLEAGGAVTHQPEFADAAAGPSADLAVTDGALALATAFAAAASDPDQRRRLIDRGNGGEA
ncbi:amidohydrolase [Tsukamurella sp. 8F]|uniref:amidohydrolase n=1 Tax=unclassified Tsukamurella TaxID=2633480 RepID=UPI0023B89EA7|nr:MULTISPECIES: amidohydrolase [unclassified Tsukamurella]MDF0528973.1 amidohydrolase [Tsukamurella sp. 8J]MDF0587346.1 amidohydrolase [Tsukamurella sp. 8F]